jgi:hypothetical protein
VLRDARGRRSCALSPAIHEATAHALDQSLSLPMCERACACMRVRSVCQASARAHRTGCVCSVRLTIAARLFMCSPPITEPMSCAGSVSATAPGDSTLSGRCEAIVYVRMRRGVRRALSQAACCVPCASSVGRPAGPLPDQPHSHYGRFPLVPFPLRQAAHPPLHSAASVCKRPSCPARRSATRRKPSQIIPFFSPLRGRSHGRARGSIRCGALICAGRGPRVASRHLCGRARTSRTQTTRRDHL